MNAMPSARQFMVQHDFGPLYKWGHVGENITTIDEACEAIVEALDGHAPQRSRWLIELIERDGKRHVTDITDDVLAAVSEHFKRIERERGIPLPAWHPQYQPPEQPVRRLADIVGAQI